MAEIFVNQDTGELATHVANILVYWRCENCNKEAEQLLTEIPEVGTPVCQKCSERMTLRGDVEIENNQES